MSIPTGRRPLCILAISGSLRRVSSNTALVQADINDVAQFRSEVEACAAVQASLAETLGVMSADVIDAASMTVPLSGRHLDASGIVADAGLSGAIRSVLAVLAHAASAPPSPPSS